MTMQVLFVHGMGRSPISAWPMLRRLRQAGLETTTFGYVVALEKFDSIVSRLQTELSALAEAGPYIVVGHSLGGVLLRAAIHGLPAEVPRPQQAYLLGSPMQSSRMAVRLKNNWAFRIATGDCGQLLSSQERMNQIAALSIPTIGIAGVRGVTGRFSPFGLEPNDGVVSLSEVSASWLTRSLQIPVIHTLLPASSQVADIILNDMRATK